MKFSNLEELFRNRTVAVVGDLMLDVYLKGKVSRISPEAPVPIIQIDRRSCCLGGAGNVMLNLANLGARVLPFGVTGEDAAGAEIRDLLAASGITGGVIAGDRFRRTTEKRRVLAGAQQLLREDYEDIAPVADAIRKKIVSTLSSALTGGEISAVIFEDYGKGLLTEWMLEELIAAAGKQSRRIITALDPKPGNLKPVKNLTVIKPNRNEAFAMAGIRDEAENEPPERDPLLAAAARKLRANWQPEYLLISLAAQGMALFENAEPQIIPTHAREVYDVSGAGDTVTSVFTLALASGYAPAEAAELANRAAGVVVAKIGTSPITLEELKGALES